MQVGEDVDDVFATRQYIRQKQSFMDIYAVLPYELPCVAFLLHPQGIYYFLQRYSIFSVQVLCFGKFI